LAIKEIGKNQQKEGENRYAFQWLWMKWRVISTDYQLEAELAPVEHDLNYMM
jgi:hypothetical protein